MEEAIERTAVNIEFPDTQNVFRKNFVLLSITTVMFIVSMIFDGKVKETFLNSSGTILFWMGAIFVFAVYKVLSEYTNIKNDIKVIEDLVADSRRICLNRGEIPLMEMQSKSFFVKQLARICSEYAQNNNAFSISSYREKSLKSEYFGTNKSFNLMASVLSLLGMAGTIVGLMESLSNMSAGEDITTGIAYALGTTLLGIFGAIAIGVSNNYFKNRKEPLFYAFLDIIETRIKEEVKK